MKRPVNLALTGFMGTGKTTVGRIVANRLGFTFVDSDEIIEREYGPISEIFSERGEAGFREIERKVARRISKGAKQVVATGGGLVVDPESRASLSSSSLIFCLTASPDEIYKRIAEDPTGRERPMLDPEHPKERIRGLLAERESTYSEFDQIVTDGRSPHEIADDVIRLWNVHYPS